MEKQIKEVKTINHIFHDKKENVVHGLFMYPKRGNERIEILSSIATTLSSFNILSLSSVTACGYGTKSIF